MRGSRPVYIHFADYKLKDEFTNLEKDNLKLYKFLNQAIDNLKQNPFHGVHIPKRLIPKIYIQKYGINNLWKCNLPDAWRLIYSIIGSEADIIALLLEWLSHKEYERRFNY